MDRRGGSATLASVAFMIQPSARRSPMERCVPDRPGLEINRLGFGGIPIQRVSEVQAASLITRGESFADG